MPHSSSPLAPMRRALIEDVKHDRSGWIRHGVAALAVSVLGLGVAGSVALTGAAQHTTNVDTTTTTTNSTAEAPERSRAAGTSRSDSRPALDSAQAKSVADQRAEELTKAGDEVTDVAKEKVSKAREGSLEKAQAAARAQAQILKNGQARTGGSKASAPAPKVESAPVTDKGKSCMPVRSGYSVAARFGQVGSWSRYHTGYDFSAGVGTPLHAPAAGVVTNAGGGPASGWAGNYVVIRHADGSQTLMAHMSTVSVQTGQSVSACQAVGAIGMTGRTFGPHVHFEVYPAGITPGDVYKAVDPLAWLRAHNLQP